MSASEHDRMKLEVRVPQALVDLMDDLRLSVGLTRTAFVSAALSHFSAELLAVYPAPKRVDAVSKLDKIFRDALKRAQNSA